MNIYIRDDLCAFCKHKFMQCVEVHVVVSILNGFSDWINWDHVEIRDIQIYFSKDGTILRKGLIEYLWGYKGKVKKEKNN